MSKRKYERLIPALDPAFKIIEYPKGDFDYSQKFVSFGLKDGFALNFAQEDPTQMIPDLSRRLRNEKTVEENQKRMEKEFPKLLADLGFENPVIRRFYDSFPESPEKRKYVIHAILDDTPNLTVETGGPPMIALTLFGFEDDGLDYKEGKLYKFTNNRITMIGIRRDKIREICLAIDAFLQTFLSKRPSQDTIKKAYIEKEWTKSVLGDPYFAKYFTKFLGPNNVKEGKIVNMNANLNRMNTTLLKGGKRKRKNSRSRRSQTRKNRRSH